MKIEYTLEEIKSALGSWTELVTPMILDGEMRVDRDQIITYLNQGFCFRFTNEDYETWNKKQPSSIHVYPAIFDEKLKFVVIDSSSDMLPQKNTDNIKVFDFNYGEVNEDIETPSSTNYTISLPSPVALQRNFTWKMHCRTWLNNILRNPEIGIFKAITIPFEDCEELFPPVIAEISNINQSAIAFFGLTEEDTSGQFNIEFILTQEQEGFNVPKTLFDISRPVPPFGGSVGEPSDYNLLPVVD